MTWSEQLTEFLGELKEDSGSYDDADFVNNINYQSSIGDTALHVAVVRGNHDIVEELISIGAEVNTRGEYGCSPLHYAAHHSDLRMAQILVEADADPITRDNGEPPIVYARYTDNEEVFQYLAKTAKELQNRDSKVWARELVKLLKREIDRVETEYDLKNT
jgi:ankyrin repeat protein